MKMHYQILTEVRFEHEFYSGVFSAFDIYPTDETTSMLKNFGLEFRQYPGGFMILFDREHAGADRSKASLLAKELSLHFMLKLKDQDLFNYTNTFNTDISKHVFYFSNSNVARENLHSGEVVSNKALFAHPLRFFKSQGLTKPFGHLVIKLKPGLRDIYIIKFEALASYWRYILASNEARSVEQPMIMDNETQTIFDGPKYLTLPSGQQAAFFVSPAPIKLTNKTTIRYQLLERDVEGAKRNKIVIRALQYPNHAYISSLPQSEDEEGDHKYSEIII